MWSLEVCKIVKIYSRNHTHARNNLFYFVLMICAQWQSDIENDNLETLNTICFWSLSAARIDCIIDFTPCDISMKIDVSAFEHTFAVKHIVKSYRLKSCHWVLAIPDWMYVTICYRSLLKCNNNLCNVLSSHVWAQSIRPTGDNALGSSLKAFRTISCWRLFDRVTEKPDINSPNAGIRCKFKYVCSKSVYS